MKLTRFIWLLLIPLMTTCIDRIEVDTSTEPNRLVIDGFLTDEAKVHTIRVTETIKFSNLANRPVNNAIVTIIGSNGDEVPLTENEPGYYETACCYAAIPGVGYKVRVRYDGRTIESIEQELPRKVELEGINIRPDVRKVFREIDNSIVDEPGIWVSIPIQPVEQDKDYYFWQVVPTFIWDADLARFESIRRCYIRYETKFQDIFIHSERDGDYERDLLWIPASREMRIRYALEINQYNIDQASYTFWNKIKKQKENVGSIFDTPPSSIQGNLYNIDNPKDIILGNFGVYQVSQQRIFFDLSDLPFNLVFADICERPFRGRPLECFSCLDYSGGDASNQKPEWWQD